MKKLLILFSLFFISLFVEAQTTNVTGTVTDSGGQVWAAGTWRAELKMPADKIGITPLLNGVPIDCQVGHQCIFYTGVLDGTGTFTQALPSNNQITPSGTQWRFTICPNASASCPSTVLTITGASQTISSQLSAVATAPSVTPQPVMPRAYNNAEITTPYGPGQMWLDVVLGVLKYVKQDLTIGTVGSGGGGGTPGGADTQVQVNQSGAFAGFNFWTVNYSSTPPAQIFKGTNSVYEQNGNVFTPSDFSWTQSPSGTISVGSNTVTLTPCPLGVAGTNPRHNLYLSGTGTPEVVMITGGTCSSGLGTGTVTFTAANTHSAGFTLASATGGLKEAFEYAKWTPSNPTGTTQLGYIKIDGRRQIPITGTLYITSTSQVIDFSSAIIECSVANNGPCIKVGDEISSNNYADVTILNLKCRAMVASTGPCLETNAQNTRVQNVTTRNALTGGYFGSIIQVDDDQGFMLDGLQPGGTWAHCDSTFCSTAVYAPGPFNTFSSVLWLSHINLSANCVANGVRNDGGNTMHISDSVIQGYAQYGIWTGTLRGGFGNTQLDNVYEEVGSCHNPIGYDATNFPEGLGVVGILNYNQSITVRGGEVPSGLTPTFRSAGNGGGTTLNYYVVGKSTTWGNTFPIYIGKATPTNGNNILGQFPALCQDGGCGTVTYDILQTTGAGSNNTAPNGTGLFAVPNAQGLTSAACTANVCSFTDTRVALTSYTTQVNYTTFWTPKFTFLAGGAVFSVGSDTNSSTTQIGGGFHFVGPNNINFPYGTLHTSLGAKIPTFSFSTCTAGQGGGGSGSSPYLYVCPLGIIPIGNSTAPVGATLIYGANLTGGSANAIGKKGSIIWENSIVRGPTALITFSDVDLGNKVAADPYGRPAWDTLDMDMGVDTDNTNNAAGLYWRAPASISEYIGATPDLITPNWKRRLTSTGETLKVPLTLSVAGGNQLVFNNTNNLTIDVQAMTGNRKIQIFDPLLNAVLTPATGTLIAGDCVKLGPGATTLVDAGACGGVGSSTNGQLIYNNLGSLAGFADGTTHQLLHGGKTFSAVDLATETTGNLSINNLNGGSGAAVNTFWRGDSTWAQPDFTNLTGNIVVSQMNSGTSASGTTFWRGDGVWATPTAAMPDPYTPPSGTFTVTGNLSVSGSITHGGTELFDTTWPGVNPSVSAASHTRFGVLTTGEWGISINAAAYLKMVHVDSGGHVAATDLGTGTADASHCLSGAQTYVTCSGGGGSATLLNFQGAGTAIVGTGASIPVYTYALPGGTIAANQCVRATVWFTHSTGTASVTYKWTFGGAAASTVSSTGTVMGSSSMVICNDGATNNQLLRGRAFNVGSTYLNPTAGTAAVDSTVNQNINFEFNVAATDQVTPTGFIVEKI